jgi:energy-coupling factor transport system ATP-binding protein
MAWVEILDFTYTYPGEEAPTLRDINLTIEQGEFVVIAGPSGGGKSTLGKALAGFLFQDEHPRFTGKILVNQTDMTQVPLYLSSDRVAYVQQNPEDQFCTLSVLDEIAFALENACLDPEEIELRVDQALVIVQGLNLRDRLLATLSGGEKQKVAIASMLALSPDVLILDEPTSNLDPNATQQIFETLHTIRKQTGLTVIIIEHKLSQLMALNPKIFWLSDGLLTTKTKWSKFYRGQAAEIDAKPHPQIKTFTVDQPLLEVLKIHIRINGKEILHDINLDVNPGEFIAIMGPNGSGKSTLLQTLMGFHTPERGRLIGLGQDLTQAKTSELVNDIGYIFQNPDHQLFTQSVWHEATLTLQNLELMTDENISNTKLFLEESGLAGRIDTHPQRLSYGEKRRLNLVAVILHNPKLLLLDEILIGQDMLNAHKWMNLLKTYTADGHAVLLVNHHAALTQTYCDRVIFLDSGKKVLDAPVSTAFTELELLGFQAFLPHQQELQQHA